jgi:hypothetical protein
VAKPRIQQTVRDMVLSMGVVLFVVGFLMAVTWRPKQQVNYPVDFAAAVTAAQQQAPWQVELPQLVGYSVQVARFEAESLGPPGAVRLYLGFTDASGGFLSVWQSDGRSAAVIAAATNRGQCEGSLGPEWTRCETRRPLTRALVRVADGVTTVVGGTVEWSEVTAFAESLQPAQSIQ